MKCGYKESGAGPSAQTQFYSLNMKSGKISQCEQTDGNKKKENIMCIFIAANGHKKRPRFVIRKKRGSMASVWKGNTRK